MNGKLRFALVASVAVVAAAGTALPAAAAMHAAPTSSDLADTPNEKGLDEPEPAGNRTAETDADHDDSIQLGICMVGVESPCNGELAENMDSGADIDEGPTSFGSGADVDTIEVLTMIDEWTDGDRATGEVLAAIDRWSAG